MPEEKIEAVIEAIERHRKDEGDSIQPSDRLEDLGIDSLVYMLVMLEIKEANPSYTIDLDSISSVKTVEELASIIRDSREAPEAP